MDIAPDRNAAPLAAGVCPGAPTSDVLAHPGLVLAQLQDRFSGVWQIEIAEPASFIAIRRPTPTAQDILVAHSLAELERKLMAESNSRAGTST